MKKVVVEMNGKNHNYGKRELTRVNELITQNHSIAKVTIEPIDKTNMNLIFYLDKPPLKPVKVGL